MAIPAEWLNGFQVNSGTAAIGGQQQSKIVGLANGGFVVVWVDFNNLIGTSPGADIVAKIYDAQGSVVRDSYQLNAFRTSDDELDFDLTATHDGFAIAFIDDSIPSANATAVIYERYNLAGNFIDFEEVASENNATEFLRNPQLAANLTPTNDDVFVAYDEQIGSNVDVNARVIDQNSVIGVEFDAGQNSLDADRLGDVAVLSNGNVVTVYTEVDGATTGIEFSIKTAAGGTVAFARPVASPAREVDVTSLDNGGFVIVYTNASDVFAAIFNSVGTQVGGVISVATGVNFQNEPSVVGLKGGGFVVLHDDDTQNAIFGQRFDDVGVADGSRFLITGGGGASLSGPETGLTADGRLLFTWAANSEVFSSVWDPRGTTINPDDYGTISANFLTTDVITTSLAGSTVLAGAKGDTILGQGGNDTIFSSGSGNFFGGAGNDLIFASNQTFFGDFELLDGGAGIDTLDTTSFGGTSSVNLVTGVTQFGPESFINFENVITGSGNDTVVGTNGANIIETGAGNDTIDAGGGNDTILAGDGNDTVNASSGVNTIFGGEGNDTIFSGGFDTVFGEGGDDTIFTGSGTPETLDGGTGIDTLDTTLGNFDYEINLNTGLTNFTGELFTNFENVLTGDGFDTITGTSGANIIETGAGRDTIDAGGGNDIIRAGDGDDTVFASSGADTIFLGAGNDTATSSGTDTIFGEAGDDLIFAGFGLPETLDGGTGIDTLDTTSFDGNYVVNLETGLTSDVGELFTNFENIIAGNGNDELLGSNFVNNEMSGGGGDDRILGFSGDDTLNGDGGNDTLNGGDGNDFIFGGDGDDRVFAEAGNDFIEGGAGNDLLEGKIGNDTINGGDGNDILRGSDGFDIINGGAGNDTAFGGNDNDTIRGGAGDDTLDGSGGNDFIEGEDGDDTVVGETGADTLFGGDGNDIMRGGGGDDFMDGENDDDLMFGSAGNDTMFGGFGNDVMDGNTQSDQLFGGFGNDILRGGDGFDFLDGGVGNDVLAGGNGNDILVGGLGVDILRGNAQNDTYVFNSELESTFFASDLIDNISGVGLAGGDVIDLSGIDADTTVGGNQAFTFLGFQSSAVGLGFGAGGLWVENFGTQTLLYGNTDNDAVIEFAVRINDTPGVFADDYIASDFIL